MFPLCPQALFSIPHCCFWSWLEKGTQVPQGLASDSDLALNCRSFTFPGGPQLPPFPAVSLGSFGQNCSDRAPSHPEELSAHSCCLVAQPSSRTSCWVMAVHLPASEPQRLLFPPPVCLFFTEIAPSSPSRPFQKQSPTPASFLFFMALKPPVITLTCLCLSSPLSPLRL